MYIHTQFNTTGLQEWEYFMGMIVSDPLRRRESLQQLKDSLPSWCNPEQAQQLSMLKVSTLYSQQLAYTYVYVCMYVCKYFIEHIFIVVCITWSRQCWSVGSVCIQLSVWKGIPSIIDEEDNPFPTGRHFTTITSRYIMILYYCNESFYLKHPLVISFYGYLLL